MKKQFLFILLCALSFAACTQNDQSLDSAASRRTLSASVESVLDFTRAGLESDGAFFWHEGDKIGTLMTNGLVRPMTLANGDGGKSTGTFEITTNEFIGNYAFYPYNDDSSVNADGQLTINFPAEYNYGSVIGEKENSFGFAMWGQVAQGAVGFKHLGGVFKIYVNDLPVGENMQFSLSTPGKKLTGDFTTLLNCEAPVLETSDDEQNNTVVISFSNTKENASAVFYVPVPVGTYPEVSVSVKDANGEEIAFGYWTNQTVERRAQKKGTIGKKEVTGGEIDGVYSPEEGVYEISNLAGLKWVAEQVNTETTTFEGETIVLLHDVTIESHLNIAKSVNLDLNGKTITAAAEGKDVDAIWVRDNANVIITGNGTINATYDAIFATGTSKVTIENGTFIGAAEAVYAQANATVEILGGSFKSTEYPEFTLNLKDSARATASIVVKGGKYFQFNPADNAAEGEHTNFVADGYTVEQNDDWYIVK